MEIVKSVTSDRIGKLAEAYTATGQLIDDAEPTQEYYAVFMAARSLCNYLDFLLQILDSKGIRPRPE